jgi:TonB family protein
MSCQPLWLRDLVAYSIQAAALVGVGVVMARTLRLRMPRVRLAYWQALLAVCVILPLLQPWRPEVLETSGFAMSNITLAAPAAAAPSGPSFAQTVFWVICVGIALRALWMALGLGRLWVYRRGAQRIEQTPQAVEEAQRLAPVFPALFISRQIPTPATFGIFRPAVLFPARFLDMEPAMQKAVALHELLHVERRDWLWNMFEEVVLTLLWFHLPLWWVVRSARLSREQVVDAEAVRRSNARRPYLKALLEMAGQKHLAESLPAPLFLRESQLAERVALMMKEVHMSRTRLTVSILAAAVTITIAGAGLAWAFPLKTSAQQLVTPAVASAPVSSEGSSAAVTAMPEHAAAAESEPVRKLGKVYKVGGKVSAPVPIYTPEPPYTPQARESHLEGYVVLWAVIDDKGRVVAVKQSSKPLGQGLDESALNTVRTWKFKPGMREGVPVPVKVMVEVSFRGDWSKKQGSVSQKLGPANDPPAQGNQGVSADTNRNHGMYVNQEEIQRQLDEAMQQAKISQEAASKIDQKEIQEQVDEAMRQAKIAQKNFAKIDQAKIQQQVDAAMKQLQEMNTPEMRLKMQEQMKQLEKMNTPEMHRQMQKQMEQLKKMNTPEMRQKIQEAMKQLNMAQMAAPKIDEAKIRKQVEQAMEQAKIAQESVSRMNKDEVQRQLEQARKEVEQARQEARAAREEARKARQDAMRARREAEEQRKAAKPAPSATPKPAPAPQKENAPPAPPPAPPALPKTPESAGIVGGVAGGVAGGVVEGVPGGKVKDIRGGQVKGIEGGRVIGVPGGITGGVITTSHPPVPPSPSPKQAVPPPPPASPAPPSPPQN